MFHSVYREQEDPSRPSRNLTPRTTPGGRRKDREEEDKRELLSQGNDYSVQQVQTWARGGRYGHLRACVHGRWLM